MSFKERSALLIIDVQNDFCPGGALEVKDGDSVAPVINSVAESFKTVIATQDWHPANHISFASNHVARKPTEVIEIKGLEQVLWPDHCVRSTRGADFHSSLSLKQVSLILRKGTNPDLDSYSGFFENDRTTSTGLEYYLKGLGLSDIYICGLAMDYCVFFTAMDAAHLGFNTFVIENACRGVDFPVGNIDAALKRMRESGITILSSGDLDV